MEKETLSKIETAPDATLEASYGEDDFIDKKIERSYIWKLDLIVLPILGKLSITKIGYVISYTVIELLI